MTALLTVLAAVLLALAGPQIVEGIRNGHQLLIWARRAEANITEIQ
ncbi:MAG TPA: hypothetical protein VLL82_00485 [Mycobacterium sp.]|nr:hypothetical protein [Mycobacterium sp.]